MTEVREWPGLKDWKGVELPKPDNWDNDPELFDQQTGKAKRIPGPRYAHDGSPWPWGPTVWVRQIGEFTVLCYRDDRTGFAPRHQKAHGNLLYAAWVNGEPIDLTWESLDALLVDMVRFKHEGPRGSSGPRATEYFLKMVGAET